MIRWIHYLVRLLLLLAFSFFCIYFPPPYFHTLLSSPEPPHNKFKFYSVTFHSHFTAAITTRPTPTQFNSSKILVEIRRAFRKFSFCYHNSRGRSRRRISSAGRNCRGSVDGFDSFIILLLCPLLPIFHCLSR